LKAVLYGDTTLTVSPRSKDFLNVSDLDLVQSLAVREQLTKIKICDMLQNGITKDRPGVENFCGGPVPGLVYDKLKKIVNHAKVKLHRDIETKGIEMTTFLHGWKRGSKKFRNILISNVEYVPHNLVKFASNMETVINLDCAKLLSRDWTYSFYSNQLRTFIFKLHNNTLPYNTVLSHFVRGNTRNCTFCNFAENPEPEDETPFHLFFDCAATERIRIDFFKWVTNNENFNINRHDFFCCGPKLNRCNVWITVLYLFKFFIWECKLRKSPLNIELLKSFVLKEIKTMSNISKKFEANLGKCDLNLNVQRLQG
jgi:hypothetical protein